MQTIEVHESDAQLLQLLSQVEDGKTVLLARNGSPVAQVTKLVDAPKLDRRRTAGFGFLEGRAPVPDDIKTPFAVEIEEMFYGNPHKFDDELSKDKD